MLWGELQCCDCVCEGSSWGRSCGGSGVGALGGGDVFPFLLVFCCFQLCAYGGKDVMERG